MDIKYYAREIEVPSDQWVCAYCRKPLGVEAVTVGASEFAHAECDPKTDAIRHMERVFGVTLDQMIFDSHRA